MTRRLRLTEWLWRIFIVELAVAATIAAFGRTEPKNVLTYALIAWIVVLVTST